jgi:ATP-dependent Lhr-like helicase
VRRSDRSDARGRVEASRYPRNPRDVLAQQIVAMVAIDNWAVDDHRARGARRPGSAAAVSSVLDMLSGRYPSDEFAELRP